MGNSISWVWEKFFGQRKKRVLMVGLDNAGKTTLLYRLKLGKVVETSPTNCFNLESFEHGSEILEFWDIGGRWTIRTHFFPNTDGLIFVFNAIDKDRLAEANQSLINTLRQEDVRLKRAPLLILVNKIDKLPYSPSTKEEPQDTVEITTTKDASKRLEKIQQDFMSLIDLDKIRLLNSEILIKVQPCSAITGEGLLQGIDWLCNSMNTGFDTEMLNYSSV